MNNVGNELLLHVKASVTPRIMLIRSTEATPAAVGKSKIARSPPPANVSEMNVLNAYCNTSRQPTRNAGNLPIVTLVNA